MNYLKQDNYKSHHIKSIRRNNEILRSYIDKLEEEIMELKKEIVADTDIFDL